MPVRVKSLGTRLLVHSFKYWESRHSTKEPHSRSAIPKFVCYSSVGEFSSVLSTHGVAFGSGRDGDEGELMKKEFNSRLDGSIQRKADCGWVRGSEGHGHPGIAPRRETQKSRLTSPKATNNRASSPVFVPTS
jgi:hypothetical protein